MVDRFGTHGLAPSIVQGAVLSIRAIFRRGVARSEVVQDPTFGLSPPAVRGRRERIARPEETLALIAYVPEGERPGAVGHPPSTPASSGRAQLRSARGIISPKSRVGHRRVPLISRSEPSSPSS